MDVVVIGNLAHVVVEDPALRVLFVGDLAQFFSDDIALITCRSSLVFAQHRHWYVA